jgi:hypothetical protein
VITHTDAVSVPGWTGAGYIITDSDTGSGAYKIAGGGNGGFMALLAGIAQGAAAMAMLIALFAAIPEGLAVFTAVVFLVLMYLLPIFLIAVAYGNKVFQSGEDQSCLGIGRVIGAEIAAGIAAIYEAIYTKKASIFFEWLFNLIFITNYLEDDFNGIKECNK